MRKPQNTVSNNARMAHHDGRSGDSAVKIWRILKTTFLHYGIWIAELYCTHAYPQLSSPEPGPAYIHI